ncbi:glycolate oxidase iron-sulfur subunit [Gammaproteobacteria bacterium]|nr:glycolate oxidase iron-sulfur subunit [Gammaproteobacteria bacterium]
MTATPTRGAVSHTPLGQASAGLDLCVHCGFCMQACPTYLVLDDENDSPRGRIMLMRGVVEGAIAVDDPDLGRHIDRCLGCRACETACPSGVPYGQLLEATRATITSEQRIGIVSRMVLATMASPFLRAIALGAARLARALRLTSLLARLPGRPGFAFAMLEATRPALSPVPWPAASSGSRGTVATLDGCVMDGLFGHVNAATERVLSGNDYRVVPAPGQQCCGALHAHAGDLEGARALARRNIEAFERSGAAHIAVNAAGCGAMMKEYGHLLGQDEAWAERAARFGARVRDVSELLAAAGPAPGGRLPLRVTYDAPCHLHHAQLVVDAPLAVLRAIPGLDLVPLPDAERCCGGAGIYNLVEPTISAQVLAPKLDHVHETGAVLVATGNPGCHMQIGAGLVRRGSPVRCIHPVELLDRSCATGRT